MKSIGYVFLAIFGAALSQDNKCSLDEEFPDACVNPCQPTCNRPTPQLSDPSCQINTCTDGCVCKFDLLRDTESGKCVPPSDCPEVPTCTGQNEEFNSCASFCPRTCQNACKNSTRCILSCDARCDCKAGFVRDEVTSKCVKSSECSKCKCGGENEAWTECKDNCEETCYTLKHPQNCASLDVCIPGCICDRGFIRNEKTGRCILRNRCPP